MDMASPLAAPHETVSPPVDGAARRRGPLRPTMLTSARRRIEPGVIARLAGAADAFVLSTSAALSLSGGVGLMQRTLAEAVPVLLGVPAFFLLIRSTRLYAFPARQPTITHLAKVSGVLIATATAVAVMATLSPPAQPFARLFITLACSGVVLSHVAWRIQVRAWRRDGRLTPNVVVVGATDNARKLIEAALQTRDIAILGVFDDRAARSPDAVAGVPVLGDTNALLTYPLMPYVDRIVISVPSSAQDRVRALIERLRVLPNAVTLFIDSDAPEARRAALSRMADGALATVSGVPSDEQRAFAKRIQDLVLASLGLVVALPIMAVIALLIKLDSPGPVFFRQRRHGFNNEAILVWKFRSMRVEAADATASRQVTTNDDRVTRVGRVIRKLSLDELPQLINVVRGEMSLVGPRPHAIGMKTAGEDSARLVAEYAWRHRMKPGLTGWAQINGSVGAVDTPESVRRRVALDIDYIERQSFWFDLYIILVTIPALISARDVVR